MWLYSVATPTDSSFWGNYWRRLGQAPVIYDEEKARRTTRQLKGLLESKGCFNSKVTFDTIETTGRKITIGYRITATQRYMIDEVNYRTGNDTIRHLLDRWKNDSPLKAGIYYDQEILSTERSRLLNLLRERGYYKATLDNITFVVDTTYDAQRLSVDVVVDSRNLRVFRINNIYIYPNSTAGLRSNESAFDTTIAPFYDTRGRSIDFQFAKLHIEKDNEWVGKRIDKIDVPLGSQAIMIRRNGKSLAELEQPWMLHWLPTTICTIAAIVLFWYCFVRKRNTVQQQSDDSEPQSPVNC